MAEVINVKEFLNSIDTEKVDYGGSPRYQRYLKTTWKRVMQEILKGKTEVTEQELDALISERIKGVVDNLRVDYDHVLAGELKDKGLTLLRTLETKTGYNPTDDEIKTIDFSLRMQFLEDIDSGKVRLGKGKETK